MARCPAKNSSDEESLNERHNGRIFSCGNDFRIGDRNPMDFEYFERPVQEEEIAKNEAKWKNGPKLNSREDDEIMRYDHKIGLVKRRFYQAFICL